MKSINNNDYNYLENLNNQQKDAVLYTEGPSLIIAGAGSGKTRVLTFKILHLIRIGIEPYRILALTFTNKAAREMKERIEQIVGEKIASKLKMGTFHSVFLRILRQHADAIGYKEGFTIYDTSDSKSLIKMIIKELSLDEKIYKPSGIASIISNSKNKMLTPDLYIQDKDIYLHDKRSGRPLTGKIYEEYCYRCKISNAMDFDDILLNMNLLLSNNPDIRRHYQEFFKFILVDEYQDTNIAQHQIISLLTGNPAMLSVVGDDAQSIYSFRGANIDNILTLKLRYPDIKTFKLEQNYRSTQNIIDAAGSLIDKNTRQIKKNIFSEKEKGEKINVVKTYSDMEEAFVVSNLITMTKHISHDSYEDFAILYRTNAQSRVLEESLRKRNIAYRIYGGLSFYQRKEVKDMVAYFRLCVNPDDDEALKRIINYPPRGIGETTIRKINSYASENKLSLWATISNADLKKVGLNSGTINKILMFRKLIDEFIEDYKNGSDAFETGQLIFNRTGVLTLLAHENTPESISRQENLSEVLSGLKEFVEYRNKNNEEKNIRAFLSEVMLATDQDMNETDNSPKVTLMTVHAAKGLEFNHVFVAGVEEDLLPSSLSKDSLAEIEEERRLLYVAITRAKKTCTLSYAATRYRNGQMILSHPSRFLSDISPSFLNIQSSDKISMDFVNKLVNPLKNYISLDNKNNDSFTDSIKSDNLVKIDKENKIGCNIQPQHTIEEIEIGDEIHHSKFGTGKIIKIDQMQGENTITVDFNHTGIKKLLLKFAKFTLLKNEK